MFKPQLALHLYKEEAKKKPSIGTDMFVVFEKYDGWYGSMLLAPSQVETRSKESSVIQSRAGRRIPSVNWLAQSIDNEYFQLPIDVQTELHGRLIFEILLMDVTEFSELNGILNRSKGDCAAQTAYVKVHDFVPYGGEHLPFAHRYELAREVVKTLNHQRVILAEFIIASNKPHIWKQCAEHIWGRGGEGVILKRISAPYQEGKRNADIMKIKLEETFDLLVVDVVRGEPNGKYANTLGTLLCKSKDGTLHNISGMTDDERDYWFKNPSEIRGKVIEGKAMCKLANGSYREGRFKAVRHDKTAADID